MGGQGPRVTTTAASAINGDGSEPGPEADLAVTQQRVAAQVVGRTR